MTIPVGWKLIEDLNSYTGYFQVQHGKGLEVSFLTLYFLMDFPIHIDTIEPKFIYAPSYCNFPESRGKKNLFFFYFISQL